MFPQEHRAVTAVYPASWTIDAGHRNLGRRIWVVHATPAHGGGVTARWGWIHPATEACAGIGRKVTGCLLRAR